MPVHFNQSMTPIPAKDGHNAGVVKTIKDDEGRVYTSTGDGKGLERSETKDGKTTISYYDFNGNERKDQDVGGGATTDGNGQRSWKA